MASENLGIRRSSGPGERHREGQLLVNKRRQGDLDITSLTTFQLVLSRAQAPLLLAPAYVPVISLCGRAWRRP